MSSNLIKDVRL